MISSVDGGKHEEGHDKDGGESHTSTLRKFRASIGKIFHHDHTIKSTQSLPPPGHKHQRSGSTTSTVSGSSSDGSSSDSDDDEDIRPSTPLVDPSTNVDPLAEPVSDLDEEGVPRLSKDGEAGKKKKKKRSKDVSKHTFYIENSQMRLKLYARNAVSGFSFHMTDTNG